MSALYAGIPHIKEDPCDDDQLQEFEEAVLQCLSTGGSDALVDSGVGFGTEHKKLWGEDQWFCVTSQANEKA